MSRPRSLLCLAAVLAVAAACSDDPVSPSDDPVSPPQITAVVVRKVAGDSQATTVKSAVEVRPTVRVTDAADNPVPGVTVRFAVTSGGGSATGALAVTDASGLATVGDWILGTIAGTNTLRASVDSVGVAFTATGMAGPPVRAARIPDTTLIGTVGLPIPVRPAVRVADAYDNPVPGVAVTFAVSSGGGSATGDTLVTDVGGRAMVGSWVLGTVTGSNTLAARVAGLPPLTFRATGRSGPAASMVKLAGDGQTGNVFSPVDTLPAVMVRDAYGNLVEGVVVAFAVASGGGTVSPSAQTTDASGTARAGAWTLGPAPGVNTLVAEVTGLPAAMFSAVAVDRCADAAPYALGSTVEGNLSPSDCRLPSGLYTDLYAVSASGTTGVRFDMSSSDFSSHVSLSDVNGALVASTPYWCGWDYCVGTNSVRVLLGPGAYVAGAGGFGYDYSDNIVGGVVGTYALSSIAVSEDVTGCETVFIVRGVTSAQQIEGTDCTTTLRGLSYFSDQFSIQLVQGQPVTISMSSAGFDTFLELRGLDTQVANDDFGGTSNSQITFTPPASGVYVITAGTYRDGITGPYTLAVQ
jgi:hypothetical protein